jgi:hypothetical protein
MCCQPMAGIVSSLIMTAEMVPEILVYVPFQHLKRLLSREYFTEVSNYVTLT